MRNRKRIRYYLLGFCLAGCTHSAENALPATACKADTASAVSFAKDVVPIFVGNCNGSGCHSGNEAAGNLNLDPAVAYSQLYRPGSGNIDTVRPKNSLLYSQLLSNADPMPPGGKLNQCDISLVYKWIQQGGKNN